MPTNTLHKFAFIVAVTSAAFISPGQAQRLGPTKPQTIVQPVPQIAVSANVRDRAALTVPRLVTKPNAKSATAIKLQIGTANQLIRQRPKMLIAASGQMPGVKTVNGNASGNFDPGGDYELNGSGFGSKSGSVFLRHRGRTILLRINHWSDGQIFASLPDDISGLPDAASIELAVGPAGQPVMISKRFGFRAARVDLPLTITDAMFIYDPGRTTQVAGMDIASNIAPTGKAFTGDSYAVNRSVQDQGGNKRCFEPGIDRLTINVPLQPGFEITGAYFTHMSYNRGSYAMDWENGKLRVSYGVLRSYVPKFVLVGGDGDCNSRYTVKVIVTGPRGLPAQ